ncbi:hypothetical protein [Streptomyces mexicanus]|jgi:hypothetical protein|uniref:hypothetical protein n=1 Tax=Streptomyces mexicanus TaxID=178566 RepID=UPI0036CC41CE
MSGLRGTPAPAARKPDNHPPIERVARGPQAALEDTRGPGRCPLLRPAREPAGLLGLLHPDALYAIDGGGKVSVARKLIHGSQPVTEVMVRTGRQSHPDRSDSAEVGSELALVFPREGRIYGLLRRHPPDHRRPDHRLSRDPHPEKPVRV